MYETEYTVSLSSQRSVGKITRSTTMTGDVLANSLRETVLRPYMSLMKCLGAP